MFVCFIEDIDSMCSVERFVQIRPWMDCFNNCDFCSVNCYDKFSTVEQKKLRLLQMASLVTSLEFERIGLFGGEFFEGQIRGCEDEWDKLLCALCESGSEILITAALIHEQYYLQETIDKLGDRLCLCTSYDAVGRFHTKRDEFNWRKRIKQIYDAKINLHCTVIPTEDFLTSEYNLPDWLTVNLNDPIIDVEWYMHVDKSRYHECFLAENHIFRLPNRATALRWFQKHPEITARYANYVNTHSSTLYGFDSDDNLIKELDDRFSDAGYMNPECGHPYFSKCYADSEKCMMCDAIVLSS